MWFTCLKIWFIQFIFNLYTFCWRFYKIWIWIIITRTRSYTFIFIANFLPYHEWSRTLSIFDFIISWSRLQLWTPIIIKCPSFWTLTETKSFPRIFNNCIITIISTWPRTSHLVFVIRWKKSISLISHCGNSSLWWFNWVIYRFMLVIVRTRSWVIIKCLSCLRSSFNRNHLRWSSDFFWNCIIRTRSRAG